MSASDNHVNHAQDSVEGSSLAQAEPLEQLAMEYNMALHFPGRVACQRIGNTPHWPRPPTSPVLPDWPVCSESGSLLEDLLGSRQSVDAILDEMDDSLADDLFADAPRQDVLHLVAPAGFVVTQHKYAGVGTDAHGGDHVSVDSCVDVPDGVHNSLSVIKGDT
jgi:hypothetical protein